jgi:Pyridoxamine 5'-phosphate oxidase
LDQGVLCHLAVATRNGPHLTPVVYVLDGGRLWVTTSRTSVKARAWRRDKAVAGLVQSVGFAVTFRGRVRTYDALDPLSWPAAAVAGPRLVSAATRFSLKNARFFAGYAVDARRVPLAWTPPGRLFAGIELLAGRVLDLGTGDVVDGWGEWPLGARPRATRAASANPVRHLDRRVPAEVRAAIGSAGTGALAMKGAPGVTVLPVAWRRVANDAAYEAALPARFLRLARAGSHRPAALTASYASRWRAADMAGMLLQGPVGVVPVPGSVRRGSPDRGGYDDGAAWRDTVLLRLRPDRVIWWKGWKSGTVTPS